MTLYEMLEVKQNANDSEINEHYSALLSKYSREAINDSTAAQKLSDIKYAKKTLLDPQKRAEYDQSLNADTSLNGASKRVSLKKPESEAAVSANSLVKEAPPRNDTAAEAQSNQVNHVASQNEERKIIYPNAAYYIVNAIVFGILTIVIIAAFNAFNGI